MAELEPKWVVSVRGWWEQGAWRERCERERGAAVVERTVADLPVLDDFGGCDG